MGEGLSLWKDNTKLYKNLEVQIRSIYYEIKAKPILCTKLHLSPSQFSMITWNSLSDATKMLTPMNNIFVAKHITGFLPIGRNMVRRGAWKEPHCPRCPFPMENSAHILLCPSLASRKIFRSSMQKFSIWLEEMQTPHILTTHILDITASWASGIHTIPQTKYPQPITLQLQLGWEHFIHGRIHQSFLPYITDHYLQISSKRSPSSWVSVLIHKLWTLFHLPQWENRNKYVHNLDRVTDSTRERQNLIHALTTAHKSETAINFLAKDRHLLEQPLPSLKKLPNALIRAWLEEFKIAQHQRDLIFNSENTVQASSLRSFLTKPNPSPTITTPPPPSTLPLPNLHYTFPSIIRFPVPNFPPIKTSPPKTHHKRSQKRKRKKQHSSPDLKSVPPQKYIKLKPSALPPIPTHMEVFPHPFRYPPHNSVSQHIPFNHFDVAPSTTLPVPLLDSAWSENGTKTSLLKGSWRPP